MPKLTALEVEAISTAGRYADGDGLYLHVDASGNKRRERNGRLIEWAFISAIPIGLIILLKWLG